MVLLRLIALAALGSACVAGPSAVTVREGAIVYGPDDRVELFEVPDPRAQAVVAGAAVALVANDVIRSTDGALGRAPAWGEAEGLCPGEPFAEQPSAAFCSGVLVDWDLVLTAGHCVRAYALPDFKVVFDYAYAAAGRLAAEVPEAYAVTEIVAERLDPEGTEPRLDYAWLRLARPVSASRAPAAIHAAPTALAAGAPVIAVGVPGGVPMKWDAGGTVRDAREARRDYFTADVDNTAGTSGGGVFDADLVLLGVTARGGLDFVKTLSGCRTTVREPDPARAAEQITYAFQAVAGLCATGAAASSLCRPDCGSPCQALSRPPDPPEGGCALVPGTTGGWGTTTLVALALACAARQRRRHVIAPGGAG